MWLRDLKYVRKTWDIINLTKVTNSRIIETESQYRNTFVVRPCSKKWVDGGEAELEELNGIISAVFFLILSVVLSTYPIIRTLAEPLTALTETKTHLC